MSRCGGPATTEYLECYSTPPAVCSHVNDPWRDNDVCVSCQISLTIQHLRYTHQLKSSKVGFRTGTTATPRNVLSPRSDSPSSLSSLHNVPKYGNGGLWSLPNVRNDKNFVDHPIGVVEADRLRTQTSVMKDGAGYKRWFLDGTGGWGKDRGIQ